MLTSTSTRPSSQIHQVQTFWTRRRLVHEREKLAAAGHEIMGYQLPNWLKLRKGFVKTPKY